MVTKVFETVSNNRTTLAGQAYTQYIPLSMYDLQTWMGAPSLYVYDCSNAGVIVDNFKQFADQHEREYEVRAEPAAAPVRACVLIHGLLDRRN